MDELVIKTKVLFEKEGRAGVVGLILGLFDEKLGMDIVAQRRAAKTPCCAVPRYAHLDRRERQFKTSVGTVKIDWRRLKGLGCGRSIMPLREFLGREPYQSKTAELEKVVAEVVSEQSYRRSISHLDIMGQIPVPKSTAQRWIATSNCDSLTEPKDTLDILFADGTGYKRRPDPATNVNNRGELRVVLA